MPDGLPERIRAVLDGRVSDAHGPTWICWAELEAWTGTSRPSGVHQYGAGPDGRLVLRGKSLVDHSGRR
nr:hypothetical protein [Streptomyces sp. TLI_235]